MVRPQFSDVSSNDLKLGSSGELAQMDPILQESGCGVLRNLTANHDEYKAPAADSYGAFGVHVKELGGLGAGGWVKIEFLYLFFHLFSI